MALTQFTKIPLHIRKNQFSCDSEKADVVDYHCSRLLTCDEYVDTLYSKTVFNSINFLGPWHYLGTIMLKITTGRIIRYADGKAT